MAASRAPPIAGWVHLAKCVMMAQVAAWSPVDVLVNCAGVHHAAPIAADAQALGGDRIAGVRELFRVKQPSQPLSLPAEIALLVPWLCRKEAHNLTGAAIPVYDGWTAQ